MKKLLKIIVLSLSLSIGNVYANQSEAQLDNKLWSDTSIQGIKNVLKHVQKLKAEKEKLKAEQEKLKAEQKKLHLEIMALKKKMSATEWVFFNMEMQRVKMTQNFVWTMFELRSYLTSLYQ